MQKVFDYIRLHRMIEAKDKVIVGVSGGADSLCLLFVLREFQKQVPFEITAVHVEHGIRGRESLEDAGFVQELCEKEQIPLRCVGVDVPERAKREKLSLEEAGRRARYETFEKIAGEINADRIAVAHNKNDQAETMLFQMSRGSGLTGAGGIRPVRGMIIRPLLCCARGEIEDYLRGKKIVWRTDSTNESGAYSRNVIRSRVLPVLTEEINGRALDHLSELGEELRQVQDYLRKLAAGEAEKRILREKDRIRLEIGGFSGQDPVLQREILRLCLEMAGCPMRDVGRNHLESIRRLTAGQSGRRAVLPGGWQAVREFDHLIFFQEASQNPEGCGTPEGRDCAEPGGGAGKKEMDWPVPIPGSLETPEGNFVFQIFPYEKQNILQNTYTKWLDYDKIGSNLRLRTRRAGDYLVISRQGSRKKIKKYFVEEKIPGAERERVLLLARESEILWVVGHRMGEACKVTEETKRILEIRRIGEERHGREDQSIDTGGRG